MAKTLRQETKTLRQEAETESPEVSRRTFLSLLGTGGAAATVAGAASASLLAPTRVHADHPPHPKPISDLTSASATALVIEKLGERGILISLMKNILQTNVVTAVVFALVASATPAWGQFPTSVTGIGGIQGAADGSRLPFRVKLRGILNPSTEVPNAVRVVTVVVQDYREPYKFAVTAVEAVDDPQIPKSVILPKIASNSFDLRLVGTKEQRSKVGQAPAGMPLTIVGFLQQRRRDLIIESVELNVEASTASTAPPPTVSESQ